jgi:hypothetical protein
VREASRVRVGGRSALSHDSQQPVQVGHSRPTENWPNTVVVNVGHAQVLTDLTPVTPQRAGFLWCCAVSLFRCFRRFRSRNS